MRCFSTVIFEFNKISFFYKKRFKKNHITSKWLVNILVNILVGTFLTPLKIP